MVGVNRYVSELRELPPKSWDEYLVTHSGLPGVRANLELADAFASIASRALIVAFADRDEEYLRFCGTQGLGRVVSDEPDAAEPLALLRARASDGRWRVREAAARGLQIVGDAHPEVLCSIASAWLDDADPYVRRAALAALCEPRLLKHPVVRERALRACVAATESIAALPSAARRGPAVRTLRQALGYCWSVAVAAAPGEGVPEFERMRRSQDEDVRWIVRSNLTKARLKRVMPAG